MSADYAKRRDQILPSRSEQSYRTIAWRASVPPLYFKSCGWK